MVTLKDANMIWYQIILMSIISIVLCCFGSFVFLHGLSPKGYQPDKDRLNDAKAPGPRRVKRIKMRDICQGISHQEEPNISEPIEV